VTQPEQPATSARADEPPGSAPGAEEAGPDRAEEPTAARPRAEEPSIQDLLSAWVEALGARVRGHADLVMAETRLALSTFLLMIFLTLLAAGAVLFAWAFLVLALAQVPLAAGASPLLTALILLAVHLLLAVILWRTASGLGRNMEFQATRRLLSPRGDGGDRAGGDDH
jgi:hypothetical protein